MRGWLAAGSLCLALEAQADEFLLTTPPAESRSDPAITPHWFLVTRTWDSMTMCLSTDMSNCSGPAWRYDYQGFSTREKALVYLQDHTLSVDEYVGLYRVGKPEKVRLVPYERVEPEHVEERRWTEKVWELAP